MQVGGNNISIGSAGSTVASLNNTLKSLGLAIGAILIVVAVIKIIISISEESSSEKTKATMLLGIGIFFISMPAVLSMLGVENIQSGTSGNTVAAKVITVLGVMINYAGVGMILLGIITNIFAIANENSDEHAKAVKLLTSGIGALSAGGLCTYIKGLVSAKNTNANAYVDGAISWICAVMSYAGAGFIVVAIFKLVDGIKIEDPKERNQAVKLFMVGIAFLSLYGILKLMGFK